MRAPSTFTLANSRLSLDKLVGRGLRESGLEAESLPGTPARRMRQRSAILEYVGGRRRPSSVRSWR
jgi:hypothetical protein